MYTKVDCMQYLSTGIFNKNLFNSAICKFILQLEPRNSREIFFKLLIIDKKILTKPHYINIIRNSVIRFINTF
jgi:hypothetical protein